MFYLTNPGDMDYEYMYSYMRIVINKEGTTSMVGMAPPVFMLMVAPMRCPAPMRLVEVPAGRLAAAAGELQLLPSKAEPAESTFSRVAVRWVGFPTLSNTFLNVGSEVPNAQVCIQPKDAVKRRVLVDATTHGKNKPSLMPSFGIVRPQTHNTSPGS